MEKFDLLKVLMQDSKTSTQGVYNFTPIEVMAINKLLPFGTKLELEENVNKRSLLSKNDNLGWARRLRRSTLRKKVKKKYLRKLVYRGEPNMNPNIMLYMKCYLVLNTLLKSRYSDIFATNANQKLPTLMTVEIKMKNKQYNSFFDFQKSLRQLWLHYYINFENNKEVIMRTALMSKLTEECFDEVEKMNEKDLIDKTKNKIPLNAIGKVNLSTLLYYQFTQSTDKNKPQVKTNSSISNSKKLTSFTNNTNNFPLSNNQNYSANTLPQYQHIKQNPMFVTTNNARTSSMTQQPFINMTPMTTEEKARLSELAHTLTDKQLKGIIGVLRDYVTDDNQNSSYYEFDIDKLSTSHLRKLEKYINECVKENKIQQQKIYDDTESIKMNQLNRELTLMSNKPVISQSNLDNQNLSINRNVNQLWNGTMLNMTNSNMNKEQDIMSESDSFDYH